MKVLLEYDQQNGNVTVNGLISYVGIGLPEYTESQQPALGNSPSDVVRLSDNGMTADDLIKMRKAGVI